MFILISLRQIIQTYYTIQVKTLKTLTKELIHYNNFNHRAYPGCRFAHPCDHLLFIEVMFNSVNCAVKYDVVLTSEFFNSFTKSCIVD